MSAGDLAWTKSVSLRCAADGLIHETPKVGGRALAKMGRLAEMAERDRVSETAQAGRRAALGRGIRAG